MRKELGQMIRKYREKKALKRETLARKLKVSLYYVQHLETEHLAAVFSEGLMNRVVETLGLPPRKTHALAIAHNRRVKRYRRNLPCMKSA